MKVLHFFTFLVNRRLNYGVHTSQNSKANSSATAVSVRSFRKLWQTSPIYYRGLYRTPGALQAAPPLRERIRPTYRTVLLLPYYSTRCLPSLLSQRLGQVGPCQIPRPQAAPRPMPPPHAASRAAMAVDDHLGAPTVGGGCSRVAADVACRPDSEQITLPQGRSSASSLPAKPTPPPTPTPTGSRLAGTGPRPRGASASLGATCTARRTA